MPFKIIVEAMKPFNLKSDLTHSFSQIGLPSWNLSNWLSTLSFTNRRGRSNLQIKSIDKIDLYNIVQHSSCFHVHRFNHQSKAKSNPSLWDFFFPSLCSPTCKSTYIMLKENSQIEVTSRSFNKKKSTYIIYIFSPKENINY